MANTQVVTVNDKTKITTDDYLIIIKGKYIIIIIKGKYIKVIENTLLGKKTLFEREE